MEENKSQVTEQCSNSQMYFFICLLYFCFVFVTSCITSIYGQWNWFDYVLCTYFLFFLIYFFVTCMWTTTVIHLCPNTHLWITALFGYLWFIFFHIQNARLRELVNLRVCYPNVPWMSQKEPRRWTCRKSVRFRIKLIISISDNWVSLSNIENLKKQK
jgi:hypothetical protein